MRPCGGGVWQAAGACFPVGEGGESSILRGMNGRRYTRFLDGRWVLALLLLAGCGRGHTTLRVAADADPCTALFPYQGSNAQLLLAHTNVYESLLTQDDEGRLIPHLAREWHLDTTGTELTLQLRPGIRFHDGTPLRAGAVVASLERILEAGPADSLSDIPDLKMLLGHPGSITALDSLTVRILMSRPHVPILRTLSVPFWIPITGSDVPVPGSDPVPCGTGPYRYRRLRTADGSIFLEMNPDYWGRPGSIPRVRISLQHKYFSVLEAMIDGRVDLCTPLSHTDLDRVRKREDLALVVGSYLEFALIGLNNQRRPFSDIACRRALTRALDRELMHWILRGGAGIAYDRFITPGLRPDVTAPRALDSDPQAAEADIRALAAGLDRPLKGVMLAHPNSDRQIALEALFTLQLEPYGIDLELEFHYPFQAFQEVLDSGQWDISVDGLSSDNGDLFAALYELYLKPAGQGGIGICGMRDDGLTALADRAKSLPDTVSRRNAYENVLAVIASRVPCIPLGVSRTVHARSTRLAPFFPGHGLEVKLNRIAWADDR